MYYFISLLKIIFFLIQKLDKKIDDVINVIVLQNNKSDVYNDKFDLVVRNLEHKIYILENELKQLKKQSKGE